MKFISLIAGLIVMLLAVAFLPSFLGKDSAINTLISKISGKDYNQAGDKLNAASDNNSFSVKKAFDDRNASFNSDSIKILRGKKYLLTKVDSRIKQLNPFKARIEAMANLKVTDKASLVAELNAEIAQFESFIPEINKSQSKEDIRNVADKIKSVWLKSSASVKNAEDKIIALKENQLILDADNASVDMQKRIDVLKASGKDTKDYQNLLSEYSNKVTAAKQNVKSANEKYLTVASASSEGEKAVLMKETNQLLKSAQSDIKDAYKLIGKGAHEEFSNRFK